MMAHYFPAVWSVCHRQLRDPALADEAAQLTFIRFDQKRISIPPPNIEGWLFRTAKKICLNVWRKEKLRHRKENDAGRQRPQIAAPPEILEPEFGSLQGLVNELPDAQREAVTLRYLDGLTEPQIAEKLKISLYAVRQQLYRARLRLRRKLKAEGFTAIAIPAIFEILKHSSPHPPAGLAAKIAAAPMAPPMPIPKLRPTWHPASPKIAGGIAAAMAFVGIVGSALMPRVHNATIPVNTVQSSVTPQPKVSPAVAVQPTAAQPTVVAAPTVQERLDRRMMPLFIREPNSLRDLVSLLSQLGGVRIEGKWDQIQSVGISPDSVVQIDVQQSTLGEQLTAILDAAVPGKLQYVISGDQIIVQPRAMQATAAPAHTTVGTRE